MAPVAALDQLRAHQRSDQANKRCADCTETGPTYVCVAFQTFVCQSCSGLHREFGHRVKSISLSHWDVNEVSSIKNGGGNAEAAKRWLGSMGASAQLQTPSSEDVGGAREYLKDKYIEKRWVGPVKAGDDADASTDDSSQDGSQSGASDSPAAPAPSSAHAPAAAALVAAQAAQPATKEVVVQVPEGMAPGQQFVVLSNNTKFNVTVPANAGPGTFVKFVVAATLPAPASAADIETRSEIQAAEAAHFAAAPSISPPAAAPAAATPPAIDLLDDAEQPALPSTAGEGWVADFVSGSGPPQLPAPASSSATSAGGGDLFDVDFTASPQPALAQMAAADLHLLSFGAAPVLASAATAQLHQDVALGMDLFGALPAAAGAAPAPAFVAAQVPSADISVPAPSAVPETTSSGRNDDIKRLYKECEKPAAPVNSLSQPVGGRFAAFDDFKLYVSAPPAVGGFLNVPALENTAAHAGVALPPATPRDNQAAHVMSLFAQVPPAAPAAAPLFGGSAWGGRATVPQQGAVPFSADQLLQRNPQELAQMQTMISQAMNAQSQAPAPAPFAPFMAPAAMATQSVLAPTTQCDPFSLATQKEAPAEKKREFDDLVMLFKEKGVST